MNGGSWYLDASDLINGLDEEAAILDEIIEITLQKLGLDLHSALVKVTPVDTGNARAGWTITINDTTVVIENAVEYINRLNSGHSKQMPAGGFDLEIDRMTKL